MIRLFDILLSCLAVVCLLPLFLLIALLIFAFDGKPVFFYQERVGKDFVPFKIIKFRSMRPDSEKAGQLTLSDKDKRITLIGVLLRRYKLDELPQLINVIKGEMSLVGPRPEVPKYVALYTKEQRSVLSVRPGITDLASLEYFDENALLAVSKDPEKTYIEEIMPKKIALNMQYIRQYNLQMYFDILIKTLGKLFGQ